jgi:hypothetical protein
MHKVETKSVRLRFNFTLLSDSELYEKVNDHVITLILS